ncbi:MAG: hypothetical protein DWQ44_11180 [Bacteroidetes bacterium]|nr:MAG: hypothetical protein DWQ33_09300 [Bacteroidota bacterium]REK05185.1 MAG: hypothetical protein DWQ39_08310 [Bacteroidota bacterium]REK32590.1 MAG: hypothetical protein DWQ44_11180 [Bacteroidota bacterium]REK48963.1 MAG: hypothetical protein DWQ48_08780 [Bacteroidota bacterium]
MKITILNLTLICLFSIAVMNPAQGTILRVNKQPAFINCTNPTLCYNDLATAVNAASAGDTIHVEPTTNTAGYGSIVIDKPLVLIGNGYYLGGAGSNPGKQYHVGTSYLQRIEFNHGSAGSVVLGLDIREASGGNRGIYINDNDIEIRHCIVQAIYFVNVGAGNFALDNIRIQQNTVIADFGFTNTNVLAVTNLLMTNNRIGGTTSAKNSWSGIMRNNVFAATVNVFSGMQVIDNIFQWSFPTHTLEENDNTMGNVNYNIFPSAPSWFPSGNGTNHIIPMASVFGSAGSDDGKYQPLSTCNICHTGSSTASEIGMFGGLTPYTLSGIPEVPSIYHLFAPPSGYQGDSINVTISTKTN